MSDSQSIFCYRMLYLCMIPQFGHALESQKQ